MDDSVPVFGVRPVVRAGVRAEEGHGHTALRLADQVSRRNGRKLFHLLSGYGRAETGAGGIS